MDDKMLQQMEADLEQAIKTQDFELAAKIRDAIKEYTKPVVVNPLDEVSLAGLINELSRRCTGLMIVGQYTGENNKTATFHKMDGDVVVLSGLRNHMNWMANNEIQKRVKIQKERYYPKDWNDDGDNALAMVYL